MRGELPLASSVHGQAFIAGDQPFTNAKLKVTLADTSRAGAAHRVIDEVEIDVPERPAGGYVGFQFEEPHFMMTVHDVHGINVLARLEVDGKLLYTTKAANKVNVVCPGTAYATVVLQPA